MCLFFAVSDLHSQDGDNEQYYQYKKLSNRAKFHYHVNALDSCVYLYESAFKIREAHLFDQYYCALCYAKLGLADDSKRLVEEIAKKGYPINGLVSNEVFVNANLIDDSFIELLHEHHKYFLSEMNSDLYTELSNRVEHDIITRKECEKPNCENWFKTTNVNIVYLMDYIAENGFPCEETIGYGIGNLNIVLLHGKSEESFIFFDPILKSAVMTGCFPAGNYAYWVDGYKTSVQRTDEVYGTIALAMFRYNNSLPETINVNEIEAARKEIGLESFNNDLELIKQSRDNPNFNRY